MKLGLFGVLAFLCIGNSFADTQLNFVPDIYATDLHLVNSSLVVKSSLETKSINKNTLLINRNILCAAESLPLAIYLRANSDIGIYQYRLDKISYICILSFPGSNVLNFNQSLSVVSVDLTKHQTKPLLDPSFKQLLTSYSLRFTNSLGESIIPLMSPPHELGDSLPISNLQSTDPRHNPENMILGIAQPPALNANLRLINKLSYQPESRALAKELKQPYQPLPIMISQNIQPLLASIQLNHNKQDDSQVEVVYAESQTVCLNDGQLTSLKIGDNHGFFYEYFVPNADPLIDSSLKCLINGRNGVKVEINSQLGIVNIIMPLDATAAQNINLGVTNEPLYPSGQIYANFTNYQLSTGQSVNSGTLSNSMYGNFVNTTSTPIGSLVNGLNGGANTPLTRNYTFWQTDFPSNMTSLIVGDATQMPGSWGGTAAYAGIQYGSNEALRPGYFFTATPIISGSVSTPTTAQILLNGTQTNQVDLSSGQFNLYNLPIMNGDGTITVNLKNPNGDGFQSYTLPYYTSPLVLTNTSYLYQYNIGVPQLQNGGTGLNLDSYQTNTAVAAMQHYIGITNQYTMELRAEAQAGQFANLGLSHNMIWFNSFATGFSTAVSQSESGTGALVGFNLSRQSSLPNSLGFGYSANLFSNNFAQLGAFAGQAYQLQQTLFANYNWNSLTFALGYSNNSAITDANNMQLYNMTINWQFLRNFLVNSSTSVSYQGGTQTIGSNLGLTITLDGASSLNANYAYQSNAGQDANSYNLDYQYAAPSNLWGYNVGGQYNDADMDTPTGITGGGYYLFKNFNANAQGAYKNNSNYSTGASISGNAVIGSTGLSLGQYSNLSFILVKVGDIPNVGIKQNGSIIGSTDRNGTFVIPNVPPYLPQDIQINASDLPFNTELDSYSKRVVAPLNGGASVVFIPVSFVPASGMVRYGNNKMPPAGYSAILYNDDGHTKIETVYIIDNGAVLLSKFSAKLDYHLEFTVKDGTFSCPITKANINPIDSNQYVTSLGTLICEKK